jgi:hypothetical protein
MFCVVNLKMSEAPPRAPHVPGKTTSEAARRPDAHNLISLTAIFADALELAKRVAAESGPSSPVNAIPRITEVHDEKGTLSEIPVGMPAFGPAQKLLTQLRRREAESEQAMEAYAANEAAENRKEYAAAIERLLPEDGMDAVVTASGPGATTLTTRHAPMSRPFVHKVLNDPAIVCAPGYSRSHRMWHDKIGTLAKYGIPPTEAHRYEDERPRAGVCLGGDNASAPNHWPEPWDQAE